MNPLPADRGANLAIWAAVWSCLALWTVATALVARLPSLAVLLRLAARSFVARWVVLAWWAWVGWHLFVRTTP